jgi:hypothetical protein
LPCLLKRNDFGVWCGYAAVPPGHPLHGKRYDEPAVEVHGGLTYSDACSGTICHEPKPGEPDNVWWFGFDCHHADDYAPGMDPHVRDLLGGTYRDMAYARREAESLAEQLATWGSR